MQKYFEKFYENISLTLTQRRDAITKYREVCKTLHSKYYDTEDYRKTRFLFGSYKKKTAIRPMEEDQDIDVLFKMPHEKFEEYEDNLSNPQSQVLQDVKEILKEKYSTSEKVKAWGKVILVKTSDGKHNIELLPAWEQEDGSFIIPNSEDSGSWETFDPRREIKRFEDSNEMTSCLTRTLSKMIKKWAREVASLSIKSYEIENFVIDFLSHEDFQDLSYSYLIKNFFSFLNNNIEEGDKSYVKTALERSEKAIIYEEEENFEQANEEWRKIFGVEFPNSISIYTNNEDGRFPSTEEFIQDYHDVNINPDYNLKVEANIKQDAWRPKTLSEYILKKLFLKKERDLVFFIKKINIPQPYEVKWKVRNFGTEAERKNDLRGEISEDEGYKNKTEHTKYEGEHFVECYIIKDGICVARDKIIVPIGAL